MISNRQKACCFTGHRIIPGEIVEQLKLRLRNGVDYLHQRGITVFYAGGALGFDTLAAEAVLDRRNIFPDIRLVIVMPCREQTKGWNRDAAARYEHIIAAADEVICLYARKSGLRIFNIGIKLRA